MKIAALCLLIAVALSNPASAETGIMTVHGGSVGECDYCHSMHGGNAFLLKGKDQGSTCLRCHAYYRTGPSITFAASNGPLDLAMTPAGDFAWLNLDFEWPVGAASPFIVSSRAERHGHSIVAVEFGYFADSNKQVAPGGAHPASQLTCVSCHDPHSRSRRIDDNGTKVLAGKPITGSGSAGQHATSSAPVGVYRILGDMGYASYAASSFLYPAPDAVAFGDDLHVAYGQGMSEWCSNCHPAFLPGPYISGAPGQMHPAGKTAFLTPGIVNNYQSDMRYSNLLSGYSPLAPVEEGLVDYVTQRTHAASGGNLYRVDTRSNVMCLTCHRAHASAWNSAIRWPYGHVTNVHDPFKVIGAGALSQQQLSDQRSANFRKTRGMLCNKCHAKD